MPPVTLGTPGLLEDAIAAGASQGELAKMSSFFAPSAHQQTLSALYASADRGDLPSYDPETGTPWGHYGVLQENARNDALRERDVLNLKLLEQIGRIDDQVLQARLLSQYGFMTPPSMPGPPNVQGMSPTDALAAQREYEQAAATGDPFEFYQGSRLKGELTKLRLAHELNRPERESQQRLRDVQQMVALGNMQSQTDYRQALAARGEAGNQTRMFGEIADLAKAYQEAAQPIGGNPQLAIELFKALQMAMKRAEAGGISAPSAAPSAISAPPTPPTPGSYSSQYGIPSLSELTASEPSAPMAGSWWDQIAPMNAPAHTPDMQAIARLQQQLAHIKRYAPGDVGAQQAIAKQIQQMLLGPMPGAGAKKLPEGVVVKERGK